MTRNCIWIGVFSQVVTLPWSDRAARARIRHRTVRVASRCRTDRPGRMGYCHRRLTRRARVHARTRATLDTSGPTFAAFLLGVIVTVGGLIYFPMLILGPIGERIIG